MAMYAQSRKVLEFSQYVAMLQQLEEGLGLPAEIRKPPESALKD